MKTPHALTNALAAYGSPLGVAFREVMVNVTIGLTPVWIGAFISLIIADLSYWVALINNIARGDLFIGATAVVAPSSLYIVAATKSIPKPYMRRFPFSVFFIVALFILYASCVSLFTVKRLFDLKVVTYNLNESRFNLYSLALFMISVVVAFFVTYFKNKIEDASEISEIKEENQNKFNQAFRSRTR